MIEWLKFKNYSHIGLPIKPKFTKKLIRYIKTPDAISKHPFLPLIRRVMTNRSYKRDETGIRKPKTKSRYITFASHFDSAIYSYYAYTLQNKYEEFLKENQLTDIVVAYRKIEKSDGCGGKSNIDIANDVFEYIKSKLTLNEDVVAITFDIKGFFDNLDHKIIKSTWKQILGCNELSKDTYAVFKSITNYSFVHENQLFHKFKDSIICKSASDYVSKKVKSKKYLRDKNAVAFCYKTDIQDLRNSNLIRTRPKSNKGKIGIPQGLPISAVLANVYMSNFDIELTQKIAVAGGMYRRYSDDIIIVCPAEDCQSWKDYVMSLIESINLEIQESKTNAFIFSTTSGVIKCEHEKLGENKVLEYLGFSFDGKIKLLKSAGLSRYYIKMKRVVKRSQAMAINVQNKYKGKMFENNLLKRFSHIGAKPHVIHMRSKYDHSKFTVNKYKRSFGNFTSYARRASTIMNEPAIIKQLRRNRYKLRICVSTAHDKIHKGLIVRHFKP